MIMVDGIYADEDERAAGDQNATDFDRLRRLPSDRDGRRVQTHRFQEDLFCILGNCIICGVRRHVSKSLLYVRMLRQQEGRPTQRGCRRVTAGEQHGKCFIAGLTVTQLRSAFLIGRREQRSQQIRVLPGRLPSLVDERRNQ